MNLKNIQSVIPNLITAYNKRLKSLTQKYKLSKKSLDEVGAIGNVIYYLQQAKYYIAPIGDIDLPVLDQIHTFAQAIHPVVGIIVPTADDHYLIQLVIDGRFVGNADTFMLYTLDVNSKDYAFNLQISYAHHIGDENDKQMELLMMKETFEVNGSSKQEVNAIINLQSAMDYVKDDAATQIQKQYSVAYFQAQFAIAFLAMLNASGIRVAIYAASAKSNSLLRTLKKPTKPDLAIVHSNMDFYDALVGGTVDNLELKPIRGNYTIENLALTFDDIRRSM